MKRRSATGRVRPQESRSKSRIREVFQSCQHESGVAKWVKKLREIYEESSSTEFFDDFVFYIQLPITKEDRSKFANRVLEVACQFGASFLEGKKKEEEGAEEEEEEEGDEEEEEELPEFLNKFFHWLLDHHEMEGEMARLRICLMLNRLLKLMGENATIDENLYQKIYDNMQERLRDKVPNIRSQAVTALLRLQNPRDESCPIIRAFLFHLRCDPNALVRKTVVEWVAVNKFTLRNVIKRTKDLDDGVRTAAFRIIASKVHVRSLTIAQREDILKRGFLDSSQAVKTVVKKDLVQAWLRHSKDDIVKLLFVLDVENSSDCEIADSTLAALFEGVPNNELLKNFQYLGEDKLIPLDKLTSETAVYWRTLIKKFYENEDDQNLDNLVPELTKFCAYVRIFVIESIKDSDLKEAVVTRAFITKQLILMMKYFDLSDEVGRSNLGALMKDMLLSNKVTVALVPQIMEVYQKVCSDPQTRIEDVAEIIAEIREPMKDDVDDIFDKSEDEIEEQPVVLSDNEKRKKQLEIGKMRVQLNELRDELDKHIEEKDFVKAQEVKIKMDEVDSIIENIQSELSKAFAIPNPPQKTIATPLQKSVNEEDVVSKEGDDPVLVHKCLEILYCLLKDTKIIGLNLILKTLLDEFVVLNIKNMDFTIRQSAVQVLGACALRSISDAKKNLLLLLQIAHLDTVSVRVVAVAALNDLLMFHGLSAFAEDKTEHDNFETLLDGESLSSTIGNSTLTQGEVKDGNCVVALLIKMLDDPDVEVRTKVIESLCKLQIIGAVSSSKLFMRMILIWFNPLTEVEGKLCHILGTFFPLYASLSRENQNVIAEAFVPTLECLWSAPRKSPLANVNVEDVALFCVQLTREDALQSQSAITSDSNVHDSLADSIANLIINSPSSPRTRFLTKALTTLQMSSSNFNLLRDLKTLHSKMCNLINDKYSLKNLERFGLNLDTWLAKDTTSDVTMEETTMNDTLDSSRNTPGNSRKRTLLSQEETFFDKVHEDINNS